jgi:hypothetical protein
MSTHPIAFDSTRLTLGLAFLAYRGVFLFGHNARTASSVVSHRLFQSYFHMLKSDGTRDVKNSNVTSFNVVSMLQAGALYSALSSAPVSARVDHRWTLIGHMLAFVVSAVHSCLPRPHPHKPACFST